MLQGLVSFGGVRKRICLAYVPEAKVGDYAIVHAGFALNLIDESEAHEIFATLASLEAAGGGRGHGGSSSRGSWPVRGCPMKYLDEYRAAGPARALLAQIRQTVTRPWTIMEVCGGQTHNLMKFGIDRALPEQVELVHGPGCPVCVTPLETLDRAMAIAVRPEVIFATFGDMLRVPGSRENLFQVRSRGGDVRIVYSPLDALNLASENPDRQVVFLAVGFETTAPTAAGAVLEADRLGLDNFSLLVSHVRVPPAIEAILGSAGNRVQAFLAAGHVCTVMGYDEYHPIAERYHVPIVVTGFEPVDLLEGIWRAVRQLEAGRAEVENQYARAGSPLGQPGGAGRHRDGLRDRRLPLARDRADPAPRAWPSKAGTGASMRAQRFPDLTPPSEEPERVQERRGAGGPAEAQRVPGVRHPVQSRPSPGRNHGLRRRRLRRVFPVPQPATRLRRQHRDVEREPRLPSISRVRCRPRRATASCCRTGAAGGCRAAWSRTSFASISGAASWRATMTGPTSTWARRSWRSRPTASSSARRSSPGAISARWPFTAPSTTWRPAEPGARWMSASFILEEGFALADLERIVQSMARAADEAGVELVTGDTKVVEHGKGDGIFITTSGLGLVFAEPPPDPRAVRPGDVIIVSGPIGLHGMAIMSVREGLAFESSLESDSAPLGDLVATVYRGRSPPPMPSRSDPRRSGRDPRRDRPGLANRHPPRGRRHPRPRAGPRGLRDPRPRPAAGGQRREDALRRLPSTMRPQPSMRFGPIPAAPGR